MGMRTGSRKGDETFQPLLWGRAPHMVWGVAPVLGVSGATIGVGGED